MKSLAHISNLGDIVSYTDVFTVIISSFAFILAVINCMFMLIHNRKSFKSVLKINCWKRNGYIAIEFRNCGTGPLFIKNTEFKSIKNNTNSYTNIVDILQKELENFSYFKHLFHNYRIEANAINLMPGENSYILNFKFESLEDKKIKQVVNTLAQLSVTVEYGDMYTKSHKPLNYNFHYFKKIYEPGLF